MTKMLCKICGHIEEMSLATCSKCGEATWQLLLLDEEVEAEKAPTEVPAVKGKKRK